MKNILITGGNGFVASNIYKTIKKKYNVFLTNRKTLDVLDGHKVEQFFDNNKIDIVIHTAVCGGSRFKEDGFSVLTNNVVMFDNLVKNKHKFGSLIHFGSGAEFDRRENIISAEESKKAFPADYYGLSKKIIKTEIDKTENFYNLRLFGCFGEGEGDTRFVKSAINNIKNKNSIIIHQDRYMDFFYIEDLCSIVDYYIEQINKKKLPKDINLCYNNRRSLLDMAVMISELMKKPNNNIIIENKGYYTEYTGNGDKLSQLGISLLGLEKGLKRYINV
jgi:nucleoside-diphosphate-sugar epimerase